MNVSSMTKASRNQEVACKRCQKAQRKREEHGVEQPGSKIGLLIETSGDTKVEMDTKMIGFDERIREQVSSFQSLE